MLRSISLVVLAGLLVAAHAWAEEAGPAGQQTVTIAKLTCKEMMAGDDMDRAATLAYFHGYRAGKKGGEVVDIAEMSAYSDRVSDYCLSNPTSTVMDAFAKLSP